MIREWYFNPKYLISAERRKTRTIGGNSMLYDCPEPDDFAETRALNQAFLTLLKADSAADAHLAGLHPELANRLRALRPEQIARLADVPFLLLSFRESDRELWECLPVAETVAEPQTPSLQEQMRERLVAAALGFAWQLARRNPYALRLLSGASLHWCERLAEQPFLAIMSRAGGCRDLPRLRAARDVDVWRKLLTDGVSARDGLRRAAQLSSLQMRLTRTPSETTRWATAACRMPATSLTLQRERP